MAVGGGTRNEGALGKKLCDGPPYMYIFYLKGKFSAASTHFLQFFFRFHYSLNTFYKAF
jgi:hypothetical protein